MQKNPNEKQLETYLQEINNTIETLKTTYLIETLKEGITCEISNRIFFVPTSLIENSLLIREVLMCGEEHFKLNISPYLFELVIIMEQIISQGSNTSSNFIYSDIPKFNEYDELVPSTQHDLFVSKNGLFDTPENNLLTAFLSNIVSLEILIDLSETLNYLKHRHIEIVCNHLALRLSKLSDTELKKMFFDQVKSKGDTKRDLTFLLDDKL